MTTIREFSPRDVSEAARLESANQPRPWSDQVFRDELAAENRIYLVADDGGLVGFAGAMIVGDEAHVTNLLVDPASRRTGVGRSLMVALVRASVTKGARHMTLEVRTKNTSAIELYQSLGLVPVGVRPGYYSDDDALIMWAHDIDVSVRETVIR